jgi:hypothetical protein
MGRESLKPGDRTPVAKEVSLGIAHRMVEIEKRRQVRGVDILGGQRDFN